MRSSLCARDGGRKAVVEKRVVAVRAPVVAMRVPVVAIRVPVIAMRAPVVAIRAPVVADWALMVAIRAPPSPSACLKLAGLGSSLSLSEGTSCSA